MATIKATQTTATKPVYLVDKLSPICGVCVPKKDPPVLKEIKTENSCFCPVIVEDIVEISNVELVYKRMALLSLTKPQIETREIHCLENYIENIVQDKFCNIGPKCNGISSSKA